MILNGWLQILLMLALVIATARPLGLYTASVLQGGPTFLDPVLRPLERRLYAVAGIDEKREQSWLAYTGALLVFSASGFVLLYAILRLQHLLPLNPQGFGPMSEHLAFNTAASFVTNTNWQSYGGESTLSLPTAPWYFLPLRTPRRQVGVVGIARQGGAGPPDSEGHALLDTLAEQTAAALERASLAREIVATRTAAETERVPNTLLASISHDFRTPLSSILGSATSLLDYGDKLGADARTDLLGHIKVEAESLDSMVRNLLAITRIDAGALEPRKDWVDLREVAEHVAAALRRRGAIQHLAVDLPPDLPLVRADPTLVGQALANIVGNAVAHTPGDTMVRIDAEVGPASIALRVTDDGPGIAPAMLPHVFDKFIRAREAAADKGEGAGLGLAIAKGIMEAHGGAVAAQSPVAKGRGTRIVLTFPSAEISS